MLLKANPKKFYNYPQIGGKAGAVVAGFAKAVNFNGSTYLATTTSGGLATTDGKKYLASFWFRQAVAGAWAMYFDQPTGKGFTIEKTPADLFHFDAGDSAATNAATISIVNPISSTGVWHHLIATADTTNFSTPVDQVVLDGTPLVGGTDFGFSYNANNINFTVATAYNVGSRGGALTVTGDMAEVYIAFNQTLDLSVPANVQKFRSVAGHPVDLGVAGATPTGTAPTCYFSVRNPSGVASDFLTNRGTGGLTWQDGTAGGAGAGTLGLGSVDP